MSTANKLLHKYSEVCKATQDKDLASRLRVTKSAVSNWRHGRAQPNAEAVERMCEATAEPLEKWLPLIEAERARTAGDRRVWLRLAQGAASLAAVAIALRWSDDPHAAAALLSPLYIMRNIAVFLIPGIAAWTVLKHQGAKACADSGMRKTGTWTATR
jgi:transcriptional regulator with XRE-family HTH domain